jgi:hypothetical protein
MPRLTTSRPVPRYPIPRHHVRFPRCLCRSSYRPDCPWSSWDYRDPMWSTVVVDHLVGGHPDPAGQIRVRLELGINIRSKCPMTTMSLSSQEYRKSIIYPYTEGDCRRTTGRSRSYREHTTRYTRGHATEDNCRQHRQKNNKYIEGRREWT